MKEIKQRDIFFIKNEWFRYLCIHNDNGFIGDFFFDVYEYFLNQKYFIVIQTWENQTDAIWFIHDGKVVFYNKGIVGIKKKNEFHLSCRITTELINHFDVKFHNSDCFRKVYTVDKEEYQGRLMLSELSL